jgi:hypothetical protein
MKKLILTSLALLLVFAGAPAMAGDKSDTSMEPAAFQALSNLSVPEQMALNTMTDKQLAVVEGARVDQEIEIDELEAEFEATINQVIICDRGSCDEGGEVTNAAAISQSLNIFNLAND